MTASYWLKWVSASPIVMTVKHIFLAITDWTETLGSALASAEASSAPIFVPMLSEVPRHTCAEATVPRPKSNGHTKHWFRMVL